jgi:hypothetical protein
VALPLEEPVVWGKKRLFCFTLKANKFRQEDKHNLPILEPTFRSGRLKEQCRHQSCDHPHLYFAFPLGTKYQGRTGENFIY